MEAEEAALNLDHWSGLVEQGYEVPAASRYMRIAATILRQQAAEIERLREALATYCGAGKFEDILWGDTPDDELVTFRIKLGVHRRARAAMEASDGTA